MARGGARPSRDRRELDALAALVKTQDSLLAIRNMILARLRDDLTPAERQLLAKETT